MPEEKKTLSNTESQSEVLDHEQIEKKREIVKEEIEKVLSPEKYEQRVEKSQEISTEKESSLQREKASEAGGIIAASAAQKRDEERRKKIEGILSVGLEEIYLKMPPDKQREFKIEGEKTAREINSLLHKTKVKVKKIIDLIRKWLALIPSVNRYFLEQEAKIKADEIMEMKNELDLNN